MKIELFDFQEQAVTRLRLLLRQAREHATVETPKAVSFSAPTGSGKTVMLAALFEDLLFGTADLPAQPDAVILWLSDMPELNEQTRRRIMQVSERIGFARLLTIDADFDAPRLEPGTIHFLNVQKLGRDKTLTQGGVDRHAYAIWETLANTARAVPDRFYLVIDEAHRGMTEGRRATEARTLVQRFLLGHAPSGMVPIPLVIGVSATPKRFIDLLEKAPHGLEKAHIDVEAVRDSGLLKERVAISHPEVVGQSELALLAEAARRWQAMTAAWAAYCEAEGEERVWPVLVMQVEDGHEKAVSRTDLVAVLAVIEEAIGRQLGTGEVVHALHDRPDLDLGGRLVRSVEASRIDADKAIGVVLFKTSLSTGWDCPRAEVMMSFRRAQDHTYIAQLLGRMVRTPLARRIAADPALNDVHLFLPHFDTAAVEAVAQDLKDAEQAPPVAVAPALELVTLARRTDADALFAALAGLVTYRVNATRAQSSLRRLAGLARALNRSEINPAAPAAVRAQVLGWLDGAVAELREQPDFAARCERLTEVRLRTVAARVGGFADGVVSIPLPGYSIEASALDLDRLFALAAQRLGDGDASGIAALYCQHHGERDLLEVKVELIVLLDDAAAVAALEARAAAAFNTLYDRHKQAIGKLKERERQRIERLRVATAQPTAVEWSLPAQIDFRRPPTAPLWPRHLYLEPDGQFRAALGTWEHELLAQELADPTVLGWLRNLDRKPWSLEIPYETGGALKPMFPDLVLVRRVGDGPAADWRCDILEPHQANLGDNWEKARGLAQFAGKHGHLCGRIELIRKASSGVFQRLDLNREAVRAAVLPISSNPQLDALFAGLAELG